MPSTIAYVCPWRELFKEGSNILPKFDPQGDVKDKQSMLAFLEAAAKSAPKMLSNAENPMPLVRHPSDPNQLPRLCNHLASIAKTNPDTDAPTQFPSKPVYLAGMQMRKVF